MCLYVNIYNVLVVLLVNLNSILASYRVHELRRQARRGLISSGKARRGLISSGKTGNRFLSTKPLGVFRSCLQFKSGLTH